MKIANPIFGIFLFAGIAMADVCPPPPSSIDPSVTVKVSFDKKSALYTYEYRLTNGNRAEIPIRFLSLLLTSEPSSVNSPDGWLPDFSELSNMPTHFHWSAIAQKGDTIKKYGMLTVASTVKPNQTISGFSFKSPLPPGVVQYHTEGKTGIPASAPVAEGASDDEPTPDCPGWDFEGSRFGTLVTGLTTGPTNPGTVSVTIRLREEKGIKKCEPINPNKSTGKLSVLVLGTKDFDPSQIVVSSLKFGPAEAAPISSKLVSADGKNYQKSDEDEEWEEISRFHGRDRSNPAKHKDLLLVFNQAALEIQCGLDKALFLNGKMQNGNKIIGGATSKTVGCDPRKPGIRPHRK